MQHIIPTFSTTQHIIALLRSRATDVCQHTSTVVNS